ncbi:MAG: S1 RNA-binding domain-containing protein [Candidatus Latescibacteria bacterium]|nr:S1 RNA-binding domain-containing protein [Candidatus Latescibacterota bacterium]
MAEQAETQEKNTTNDEPAVAASEEAEGAAEAPAPEGETPAPVAAATAPQVEASPDPEAEAPAPEAEAEPPVAEAPASEAEATSVAQTEAAPPKDGETEAAPETEGEDFAALLDEKSTPKAEGEVQVGDKVSGVLAKINPENSFVDFGGRSEGVIKTSELMGEDGQVQFSEGDPLEAYVASVQDELRLTRLLEGGDKDAYVLYQAYKSGMPVKGKVDAVNKWGLGVEVQGVRAFCPVSQIDAKFVEDTEEYRGQTLEFKIVEFRNQGRNIVVSRRAVLEGDKQREAGQVRATIEQGAKLEGMVTRLENFGAFIDLGSGVEGLLHVSELSHQRVEHPKEVLREGQTVEVAVIKTKALGNARKERISLSLKALLEDPWAAIKSKFKAGTIVTGKVDGLEDFGAFVEIAENIRGLVHVSEMADRRVEHPKDVVAVGDEVQVVVLEVDARRRRLRLSIKQVEAVESSANLKDFQARQEQESSQSVSAMVDALQRAKLID